MQLIIPFLALNLLLLLNLSKYPSFPALVSGLAPSHESNVAYDGTYDTAVARHENHQYVHDGTFRRRTFSLLPPGLDGIRHLLQLICSHTAYPGTCIQELSSFKISDLSSLNPLDLVSFSVRAATNRANEALNLASRFASGSGSSSSLEDQCASDCVSLISDAKDELNAAVSKLSSMQSSSIGSMRSSLRDVKVWMSSALSYQEACSDGLELVPGGSSARYEIRSNLEYLSEVIGNGYTLVDTLAQVGGDLGTWISGNLPTIPPPYVHLRRRRRLLSNLDASSFPRWVGAAERKLLQSNSSVVPSPDVTVAADGTGDYLNITAALRNIPDGDRGGSRYVIYIKAGVYEEIFNISKDMKKLTFIGDGIGNTVITGSRNVASGLYNTYRTSTVGISGSGFLARDITFRNTAGPSGHQAVALRAAADFLVFYRCSFEGYQDTLYALSSRQFYRECRITGTVDFIFGNAIAIFQNCELLARQPNDGQQNTYTAQGRKLAADVSGFSFQNCTVGPEAGGVTAPTFLGRPWKAYSRVIFMQSDIGAIVDPAGWLQWNQSNPFIDTLFYGEYENRGRGATTGDRVPWPGVHPNLTRDEADTFTVSNFIAGDEWLSPLQVQYHNSLF